MKLAVIGSRSIVNADIEKYIPAAVDEIVSGGAKGIDTVAKEFALKKGINYTEFCPEYSLYRKAAPLKRNEKIAQYADCAIAFWDGRSKGTKHTSELFEKYGKPVTVIRCKS